VKDLATAAVIIVLILYRIGSAPIVAQPAPAVNQGAPIAAQPLGAKSVVTMSMAVSAPFNATGAVWCFQVGCQHWGTDFAGPDGTPVFTPFDLTIIALGEYGPGPTWGQYVQGTFPDGAVFYAGHLRDRPALSVGQTLGAGSLIGYTNAYDHTHVQLGPPGNAGPCAQSGTCFDFEVYYATH
jgi:murein DD-endopeptidase MepM/ murein hydrolase activator NlpD